MSKHTHDQAMDWESSLKDKDKTMKPQNSQKHNLKLGEKRPGGNTPSMNSYPRNFDAISHISSSFMSEESLPDATSEKELGNEYFKQKKFKEAIDCYSRSIAFSPTAVAYANRAMAYLKIKRFHEAEDDCTEALNLDDRYIKAYSRRATARKELGKLKESIEDSEFALRLEPQNQEIKKQHTEVKSLYEKEILQKSSGTQKSSIRGTQKGGKSVTEVNGQEVRGAPNTTAPRIGVAVVQENHAKRNHRTRKQELNASVHELASRASSRAVAEAAKNIIPAKSAYEFEVSWRGFSGDRALQACLLKATSPIALPQIFKNALAAPILMDIIKVVATFFIEDMDLGVKYLENLIKVPRFDMLIMCLSSTDKADLQKIWDETFCNEATPIEYAEILDNLRSKYCLNQ